MNRETIISTCNEANKHFIDESLSGFPKYKYLPQWLLNQSTYLKKDRVTKKRNYKIFKRGTIIYVDFGINVGNELSGNHFAIVLNNFDNAKNGLLTVVPISSKKKPNYVPVGIIVGLQSIKHVISYSDKQQEKLRILILAAIASGLLDGDKLSDPLIEISSKGTPLTNQEAIKKAQHFQLLCDTTEELSKKTQQLLTEIRQSRKVFDTYKRYTKESFIMPSNIQSISKNRVKRLNKLDPIGSIKAPSEVLDKIDQSINERLIK
ncbi:type II toxin-antitoxin system PemK/MazF family toxin (plasmid) [Enterococcus sp. 22-H-5-01]|uniref:type II toxin-antitoxin system PemK/MazF family toxin n=1 Tax=Enterococcus sp. 22-H-5-01 TaxID=3418555 RepID=UPI003D0169FC